MLISNRNLRLLIALVISTALTIFGIFYVRTNEVNLDIKRIFDDHSQGNAKSIGNPLALKVFTPEIALKLQQRRDPSTIEWHKFAYVNYISSSEYICNSYAQVAKLVQEETKADIIILAVADILENKQLHLVKELAPSQVHILEVPLTVISDDDPTWARSLVKLEVFNLLEYDRVIYLDNDGLIHNKMDELFFIPNNIEFAACLSYWENDIAYPSSIEPQLWEAIESGSDIYTHLPNLEIERCDITSEITGFRIGKSKCSARWTSMFMVIKPNEHTYQEFKDSPTQSGKYDMEYINEYFDIKNTFVKQYQQYKAVGSFTPWIAALSMHYGALSGDIAHTKAHDKLAITDPFSQAIQDIKYIHFSDFPQPKPWAFTNSQGYRCTPDEGLEDACPVWLKVFDDYYAQTRECFAQNPFI